MTTQRTLTVSHRSSVTEDQIDHLGHMNVRYYGVNARAGSLATVAALGGLPAGTELLIDDVHTKHLAEQMVGASLEVRSGVLDADAKRLRLYHELVNTENEVRAATFVHVASAVDADRRHLTLPAEVVEAAGAQTIEIPEAGRPRSIDLDAVPGTPPLDLLRERDLHMRKPRTITAAECDADGRFPTDGYAELMWGGEPRDDSSQSWINEGPNGERLAWAVLESRATTFQLPRAGDRIQSFGALKQLGSKTSHRQHWVLDIDSGEPLVSFEVVDVCLDLDARRAAVIPDTIRESERFAYHPELWQY